MKARRQSAGHIGRADACLEHRVPAPQRLLPEWARPCELTIFHHIFIAAPGIIHQHINAALLLADSAKRTLSLLIVAMIAYDRGAFALNVAHVCSASACDVHHESGLAKFLRDTFSNAPAGACDNGNTFLHTLTPYASPVYTEGARERQTKRLHI